MDLSLAIIGVVIIAKEMVLREAKRGPNKGQQFWGCYGYPECKGVLSVEELMG